MSSAELKALVLRRIANDDLVLPAMPMVGVKALQVLRSPNGSLHSAAQVLENDPLLSARILRIANSAAYATRESAISVTQAVARLGTRTMESVLVEASAQGVFASKNREINAACQRLWEHSLATGLLARDLAILVFGLAGQDFSQAAFLAGLLHDIGKPVLAAVMLETEKKHHGPPSFVTMEVWLDLIEGAHRTVGLLVAAKWEMPALVRKGMTDLGHFDEEEPHSMRNFVRLANVLVKRAGIYTGRPVGENLEPAVAAGCELLSVDRARVEASMLGLAERVKERTA